MSLSNKTVVVSGGSRGIGRSIVLAFADKGARVAFTYLNNSEAVSSILEEAKSLSGQIRPYMVDAKDQQQVKGMIADVIKEWGSIDILINNAGIRKDKTLAFMSSEDWNDVLQTNITGAFYLTQAGIFHMIKRKKGRIINLSSISGINGIAGQTNYSSSKAALIGFTRSLAKEVAAYGISVNAIAPGGVDTDMVRSMRDTDRERLIKDVPMGRMCTSMEVAKVALFLADDELSPDYLTGSVLCVDGGYGT